MKKNNNTNIKEICEYIWELEKSNKLNNIKILDVYLWQVLRKKLGQEIALHKKLFKNLHPKLKANNLFINRVKILLAELYYFIKKPVFRFKKNKKIDKIFFSSIRTKDGQCIYLKELINKHKDNGIVICPGLNYKSLPDSYNISFLIKFYHFFNKRFVIKKSFSDKEVKLISNINNDILQRWGFNFKLKETIQYQVITYSTYRKIYKWLLTNSNIETAYFITSYSADKQALIDVCKELKIKTVEIQHGTITKYHLGYSYPNNDSHPLSPDELWTFGDYWHENIKLSKNIKARTIGSLSLEPYIKVMSITPKNLKTILFCSEGPTGDKLFEFAGEVSKKLKNYQVLFKPHPSEFTKTYISLKNKDKNLDSNLKVLRSTANTYDQMLTSEFMVGVSSTTLLESLELNCRLVIVNFAGSEYLDNFAKYEDLLRVSTPDEFVEQFRNAKKIKKASYYFSHYNYSMLN